MMRALALVGPTAVGKTAVSLELARRFKAEIVSCDSMQVYRKMQRLSLAPNSFERAQALHHLIDCVEPTEAFNAGKYYRLASEAMSDIQSRGKNLVIVGGTGLYLKAVAQGLCEAPPADAGVRKTLSFECEQIGPAELHRRLSRVDPDAARKINAADARRIVRALEVFAVTGRKLSEWWATTTRPSPAGKGLIVVGLLRERDALYSRIHERLVNMIYEDNIIADIPPLLSLSLSPSAKQVHGLSDLAAYLEGKVTLKETIAVWEQRVRNYAKRQLTWFRGTPGIRWVAVAEGEPAETTAARVLEAAGAVPATRKV